jgi:hypothetical protein
MPELYIKKETINRSKNLLSGNFVLSDGTLILFDVVRGGSWNQWGAPPEKLSVTVKRLEEMMREFNER